MEEHLSKWNSKSQKEKDEFLLKHYWQGEIKPKQRLLLHYKIETVNVGINYRRIRCNVWDLSNDNPATLKHEDMYITDAAINGLPIPNDMFGNRENEHVVTVTRREAITYLFLVQFYGLSKTSKVYIDEQGNGIHDESPELIHKIEFSNDDETNKYLNKFIMLFKE